MTEALRKRTLAQLGRMDTPALREMAGMMERDNKIEKQILSMIVDTLLARGEKLDGTELGMEGVDASIAISR